MIKKKALLGSSLAFPYKYYTSLVYYDETLKFCEIWCDDKPIVHYKYGVFGKNITTVTTVYDSNTRAIVAAKNTASRKFKEGYESLPIM